MYRSTELTGNYQRLNSSIIPYTDTYFFDAYVEPGKTYYYNFTVVQTDLSESSPSGRIVITARDTMAPNIYHSPVYIAPNNRSLMINATILDNVGVQSARVYYRTTGEVVYRTIAMTAHNDRYSAIISSTFLSLDGLEYYIEAFDGLNTTTHGSALNPHVVVIQSSVSDSSLGDVNGDGLITTLDALMLVQHINGRINLSNEQFQRADLNKDGQLSAFEALMILQYVSGKLTSLAS